MIRFITDGMGLNRLWHRGSVDSNSAPYQFKLANFKQDPFNLELTYDIKKGFQAVVKENGNVCEHVTLESDFAQKGVYSKAHLDKLNRNIDALYSIKVARNPDNSVRVIFQNNKPSSWICCSPRRKNMTGPKTFAAVHSQATTMLESQAVQAAPQSSPKPEPTPAISQPPAAASEPLAVQAVQKREPIIESEAVEKVKAYICEQIKRHKSASPLIPSSCTSTIDSTVQKSLKARLDQFLAYPIQDKFALGLFGDSEMGEDALFWNKAEEMLTSRKAGDPLPWIIDALQIRPRDAGRFMEKLLEKIETLSLEDQKELKEKSTFVWFILNVDGCGVNTVINFFRMNHINEWGNYQGKVVSSFCSQFINHSDSNILAFLAPGLDSHVDEEHFEKLYLSPLTLKEVETYFKDHKKEDRFELIKGLPFLNRLVLHPFFAKALEELSDTVDIKDFKTVYAILLDKWIAQQMEKLKAANFPIDEKALKRDVLDFCKQMAQAMKENEGSIRDVATRFDEATPAQELLKQRHLRFLAPMKVNATGAYEFFDPAFIDYFENLEVPAGEIKLLSSYREESKQDDDDD